MVDELELILREGVVGLRVRVKPGARRTAIIGVDQGVLVVSLAAPPHDGQANKELLRLFARVANVPLSRIELSAGASGRHKLVRFRGVELSKLRKSLLEQA
jgi:uncharacterized protein (TIGR00251 family)